MNVLLWVTFAIAYAGMAVMPGPVTLLVMSYALTQGRRSALAVVAGTTLGDASCMAAAMLGLGAVLRASAVAFLVLKLAGAAYLVWLGVAMWRAPPVAAGTGKAVSAPGRPGPPPRPAWRMFLHAYLTTVLNPKTVLFFMVFLPQFIDPRAGLAAQLGIFALTIIVVGGAIDGSYSLFAARLRRFIRGAPTQRAMGRVAGGVLVGEGVLAAVWRGATL